MSRLMTLADGEQWHKIADWCITGRRGGLRKAPCYITKHPLKGQEVDMIAYRPEAEGLLTPLPLGRKDQGSQAPAQVLVSFSAVNAKVF
jgi:hypothetical protein